MSGVQQKFDEGSEVAKTLDKTGHQQEELVEGDNEKNKNDVPLEPVSDESSSRQAVKLYRDSVKIDLSVPVTIDDGVSIGTDEPNHHQQQKQQQQNGGSVGEKAMQVHPITVVALAAKNAGRSSRLVVSCRQCCDGVNGWVKNWPFITLIVILTIFLLFNLGLFFLLKFYYAI